MKNISKRTVNARYVEEILSHPLIPKDAIKQASEAGLKMRTEHQIPYQRGKRFSKRELDDVIRKRHERIVEKYEREYNRYKNDPKKIAMLNADVLKRFPSVFNASEKIEDGRYYDHETNSWAKVRSYDVKDIEKIASGVYSPSEKPKPLKVKTPDEVRRDIKDKEDLRIYKIQTGKMLSWLGMQYEELPTGELVSKVDIRETKRKQAKAERLARKREEMDAKASESAGFEHIPKEINMDLALHANRDLYEASKRRILIHSDEKHYEIQDQIYKENMISAVLSEYRIWPELAREIVSKIERLTLGQVRILYNQYGYIPSSVYIENSESDAIRLNKVLDGILGGNGDEIRNGDDDYRD